jgi:hypothetical protein
MAGFGEVARPFGRVAVIGDGHLPPSAVRGPEGDYVGHVVGNPWRHAHRGHVLIPGGRLRLLEGALDPKRL